MKELFLEMLRTNKRCKCLILNNNRITIIQSRIYIYSHREVFIQSGYLEKNSCYAYGYVYRYLGIRWLICKHNYDAVLIILRFNDLHYITNVNSSEMINLTLLLINING